MDGNGLGTACRFSGVGGTGMGQGGFSSSVQQHKATSWPPGKVSTKMIVCGCGGGYFVCVGGYLCVCVCVWGGGTCACGNNNCPKKYS